MSAAQQGWICPRCERGVSPLVSVCPCRSDGSAGVTALPVNPLPAGPSIAPYPFPGSSITVSVPGADSSTLYGTGGTVVGTIWEGVTITAINRVAA